MKPREPHRRCDVRPVSDGGAIAHPDGRRGRGALSNESGRFEAAQRVALDDGWGALDAPPPPLRTQVYEDSARTVIARNDSPDVPFDQSINPYRGCEHGCIYCFARPSHAWLGLSPGLDFESRLLAKPDAAARLERELRRPNYRPAVIAMGTNTDVYQPVERERRITRQILEVLNRFNNPVSIVTKSALITRDIDILGEMAVRGLASVCVSLTSLDRHLARSMEPRAATPNRRLETIRALADAGIPTGVMVAPVVPAINDTEIEAILSAARDAGARRAGYILLRLPLEIKGLFREWLAEKFPERAGRVMRLLRESRGGQDYDPAFHRRMSGTGPYAQLIAARFRNTSRRLGLTEEMVPLDVSRFRVPPAAGDQLDLFSP